MLPAMVLLVLALFAPSASAASLGLPPADAIAAINACQHGDAGACVGLAAAAERSAMASTVDHAWGNDDIAVYRVDQAKVYLAAACTLGVSAACHADSASGCADCDALTGRLEDSLGKRCQEEPAGDACARLHDLGWTGVVGRVALHDGTTTMPEPGATPRCGPTVAPGSVSGTTATFTCSNANYTAWSDGRRLGRARVVTSADGKAAPTDKVDRAAPPLTALALASTGVVYFVAQGRAWSWSGGDPLLLGPGSDVAALADGRSGVVVRGPSGRTNVVLYGTDAIETGTVVLPPDSVLRAVSMDGTAMLLSSPKGWAEVDLTQRDPAWPKRTVPPQLAAPGRAVQIMDLDGIPLAGVDLGSVDGAGNPVRTDMNGRGTAEGPTVGGADGLERLALTGPGTITMRSTGEQRARMLSVGAGVQLTGSDRVYTVVAVDPDGAWAQALKVGDAFAPLGPPPATGWSVGTLWSAAQANWPAEGLLVRRTTGGADVELPGGPACSSGPWSYRSLDGYCPNPALVGAHLKALPAAVWGAADLVGWMDGTWDRIDPAKVRRARLRARVEALLADPRTPPDSSRDPAEEVEAQALLGLVREAGHAESVLDGWFPIPPAPVPPIVVHVHGPQIEWDGRPVVAEAFADEVHVPAGEGCDWLFYADHDTFVRCGDVYVRRTSP